MDWNRLQREWENERRQEIKDMGCFMGDAWRQGYSRGNKVVELSFASRADLTWERVRNAIATSREDASG